VTSPFVWQWVAEHARATPSAPAVDTPSARLDFRTLDERVRAFAAELAGHGLSPHDRVLIALPNCPAAVVASLAVQRLGGCAVEVNRDWGERALSAIATQTQAKVAVILGRDTRLWGGVKGALQRVWVVHPSLPPPAMARALRDLPLHHLPQDGQRPGPIPDEAALPAPSLDPARPALLVFTSGSTGVPRAVIQTHLNIDANSRSIISYLGLTAADRAMAILPLFYCYGKSVLQTHLCAGGSVFFDDRFMYPRVVMEAIIAERCTGFAGVPLTFELLKRHVEPELLGRLGLRYLTQAGGAMHPDTIRWTRQAFAPARLYVMYGQTEATARLSYLPPERAEEKAGSIGIAISGVELAVVDETGAPRPRGEVGHLVARGKNVTPGYFQAEEQTREILRDGWLWTGDLGYQDADDFLFLTGRAKDILKIGGHRVSPLEIEQAIATHPNVEEVAVVGLADEALDQVAAAFVVRRPGEELSAAALKKYCRERLAPYQVPKHVRMVTALPRSSAGKVQKAELQRRLVGRLAEASTGTEHS
jgi:long-chain acyl-CoA synthetase